MTAANLSDFLHRLTRGMSAGALAEQSDRQLVEQFLAAPGEAAFEAIVRRHGPMVYRVCWRVLRHEHDVEDAFQATFLVLARQCHTVRKRDSLASWLHGVAHRVALKARARAAARRRHERRTPPAGPPDAATWGEVRTVLDAEIAALPQKWRLPVVLCYLEGHTQEEAADQLGWGKNTLRRRLEEARAALGRRLDRRGVWPAAVASTLLSDCVAPAALPPRLVSSTVEAVARPAAATTAVSAEVAALAEGVLTPVTLTTFRTALAILLAVSSIVMAAGLPVSRATPILPPAPPRDAAPARDGQGVAAGLAGRWVMTLPAGFQHRVVMRPLGGNRLAVENAVRFSGVYELRKGRLVLVQPTIPGERAFEWEVRATGDLVLVAQPPVAKTGQNYLGAVLIRSTVAVVDQDAGKDSEK
jgi:RNA polymerase sigma factor (sigma-70 family)